MANIPEINGFYQSSPTPAWLATRQGHCVYANPALERFTGLIPEQIKQSDWRSFLLDEDRAIATAGWETSIANRTLFRTQARMRRFDGVPTRVELIAFGHKVDDGREFWLFTGLPESDSTRQHPPSETQIQATLNVIPAYTFYTDPSGALTFVNERLADYLGLPKGHSIRSGIATGAAWDSHLHFVHPEEHEETRKVWSTCLRTGCAGQTTFRVRNAEGKYRWFLSRAEPFRTGDGTVMYWIGVNLDIDDAKQAEDALRKSEKELREVIDTIPGLIAIMNAEGGVEHVNHRILEYFGKTLDELKHWTTADAVHPDDLPRVIATWKESVRTGTSYEIEHRLRQGDGAYRWFQSRGFPFRDGEGRVVRWHNLLTDINERKHAEQALERSEFYVNEGQRLAHMGSWAFNPSGFFDYWSDELYQIYGLDPQKGAPTLERYLATLHPQDRDSMAQTIKTMHTERCGCDVKKRIVRPNGEQRYIRCVGIPVVEGEVLKGFLGTAMDVTDQELLTQELERRQAHLTEAQRLTQTGSWIWRVADRNAVHLSEEWYRIFGFDPDQGAPAWEKRVERVHPEDRLKWKGTIERAIANKADYDLEFRILVPNGLVKWIHTVGHPILSDAGELEQFVGSSSDISERKSAEQEHEKLRQLEADLAHTNRVSMLGELAASLAHEIKQPIAAAVNSANSCIEWLSHEPPNLDRARAAAARIDNYGNRAARIIDHIRSLYKKSPSRRELVDVNGIIYEILTLLQGEANRSSVAMRTELDTELPKIEADRVQLQQVFMNLMLNAIEAMQDAGGELTVRSQCQKGQLLFLVRDTGVGVPSEHVDQIFSAFFTTKSQGSGMGLAISRSIVESHGGSLWVTANDGRGTTFHFTLPKLVRERS